MVILQFNKLIRNKWVWGVFAILVSLVFVMPDDFFADYGDRGPATGTAGSLGGEAVEADYFTTVTEDIRGFGENRDWKRKTSEINRLAWETLGTLAVAKKSGLEATDAEVRATIRRDRSFQQNGQFNFALYQRLLAANRVTPERFEAFLKRRLTAGRVNEAVLDAAGWVSQMELDRAVADMTDQFTVKVVKFEQNRETADKVTLDDAGLRKWYDENVKSLALPERVKLRMVKFDATDAKVQAKMKVTEDEMRDHYDATVDKYTSKDTNGVEVVKKFEEVKDQVAKELRQIAAVQFFETNLNSRAYAVKAEKGVSRLDTIAKEEGLKVRLSDWYAVEGEYVDGFMMPAAAICPGAAGFQETVAELDPANEDLRYGVVSSDRAVWLIEKAETSPAHTPTFDAAKEIIRPRALKAAREDAFKAEVEAAAKKGVAAVLAAGKASTNLTFSVADMPYGVIPDAGAVASATRKLDKGGISDFTRTGARTAILVVCEDRQPGDAAKAALLSSQIRDQILLLQRGQLSEEWRKWNLARIGFEPTDFSSVDEAASEEAE